jgi:hypothetical protein
MLRSRLVTLGFALAAVVLFGQQRCAAAEARPALTAQQSSRAAWLWENRIWRKFATALLDRAAELKIGTLYIALDVDNGKVSNRDALRRFLAAAHARHMTVLAVEGDPHFITRSGRAVAVARARAIRAYNLGVVARERLDGLQYDIEPYVLPGFGISDPADLKKWSDTYRVLRHAFARPLNAVLPFWIADHRPGTDFVRNLAPSIDGITVMAYRDTPDAIVDVATRLLDVGIAVDRPVRVALENGPTDEGEHVSFDGDLDALLHAIKVTLPTFAKGWSSFSGFAIHGIVWPGQSAPRHATASGRSDPATRVAPPE